ncbi:MAG: hypothetical protein NVS2B5_15040 [Beijerinckiaceae bacterium]
MGADEPVWWSLIGPFRSKASLEVDFWLCPISGPCSNESLDKWPAASASGQAAVCSGTAWAILAQSRFGPGESMTLLARHIDSADLPELSDAFSLLLDTALDAAVVMRADGTIGAWSNRAEATFGWRREEAVGQLMSELIVPVAHREAHTRGLAKFLATGEGPVLRQRIEITALRKGGEEFPIELSICPVPGVAASPIFVGFIRDISDRRQNEALLQRQLQEATLLHRITSLAAGVATFEEVLRECLSAICTLTGWPAGHAYLPAGEPVELIPSAIWHCPQDRYDEFREVTEASIFIPGAGLPGHVWETGGPVWIANAEHSPHFSRGASAAASGLPAAFAFPLKAGDEIVAILEFFCETQTEPAPNTLLVIQTMGDQVGRVIERRRGESKALAEIKHRKQIEKHQQLLLAELNHRVKNMLAVVIGIATQTAKTNASVAEFNENFVSRLQSLSRGYDLLTASNWAPAALHTIAAEVIAPHLAYPAKQLSVHGPDISVAPKAALALSMIFHELVTNAAKYGALAIQDGKIEVEWVIDENNDVQLRWQEFGVPLGNRSAKHGFGTRFIKASVRHELGGSVGSLLESGGILYNFEFPLEQGAEI